MRLGVLGGTFDPIHVAHVFIGAAARHQLQLDRVLYTVANQPWQKEGAVATSAADRLAMVEHALQGIDGLEASDVEIARGGTTYTADTVAELRTRHPEAELFLITGTDVAAALDTWERVDEVRRNVTLVVVTRPGAPPPAPHDLAGWNTARIQSPLLDLSSTYLRHRLHNGEPVDGLIPAATVRFIRERGLYALPR